MSKRKQRKVRAEAARVRVETPFLEEKPPERTKFGNQKDRWTTGGVVAMKADNLTPEEFLLGAGE